MVSPFLLSQDLLADAPIVFAVMLHIWSVMHCMVAIDSAWPAACHLAQSCLCFGVQSLSRLILRFYTLTSPNKKKGAVPARLIVMYMDTHVLLCNLHVKTCKFVIIKCSLVFLNLFTFCTFRTLSPELLWHSNNLTKQ